MDLINTGFVVYKAEKCVNLIGVDVTCPPDVSKLQRISIRFDELDFSGMSKGQAFKADLILGVSIGLLVAGIIGSIYAAWKIK